jgi:hypothetical protein
MFIQVLDRTGPLMLNLNGTPYMSAGRIQSRKISDSCSPIDEICSRRHRKRLAGYRVMGFKIEGHKQLSASGLSWGESHIRLLSCPREASRMKVIVRWGGKRTLRQTPFRTFKTAMKFSMIYQKMLTFLVDSDDLRGRKITAQLVGLSG